MNSRQNQNQTKKRSRKRKQNCGAPEDVVNFGSPPPSTNSSNPDLSTAGDSASKMFRTSAAVAIIACDDDNNMESLGAECELSVRVRRPKCTDMSKESKDRLRDPAF